MFLACAPCQRSGCCPGNFIYKHFPADTYVVSLDDDIEGIKSLSSTNQNAELEQVSRKVKLVVLYCSKVESS